MTASRPLNFTAEREQETTSLPTTTTTWRQSKPTAAGGSADEPRTHVPARSREFGERTPWGASYILRSYPRIPPPYAGSRAS